jgi:CTP:molybdopterin cytidylyltransferase MocA
MASNLAAIVTAAGASTRMGDEHKALLPWRGEPLVAHQVHSLQEVGFDTIVVVTGAEREAVGEAVPEGAVVVHNDDWETGRSGSIEAGAAAVPDAAEAILVVAVDQPLSARVLDQIVGHAGAPLVQPADDEGAGHPVILGGGQLEALRNIRREPEGLRTLVDRVRPEGQMVQVDELPHWDLNTREAYLEAREGAEDRNS